MDEDENYDLLPHKEIVRIKKELEDLKKSKETTQTKNIVSQITQLKDSIDDLMDLFKEAEESLKLEEKEPAFIKTILNKFETISDQNTRIAEGIVAVADMVKELKHEKTKPEPPKPLFRPSPPQFGAPPQPPMQQAPPPPSDMPPFPDFDIPPPPDFSEPRKKKGLFGFKK